MNNFPYAYDPLMKSEGGYANDPADPGGETYAGITRKDNPAWAGWKILDGIGSKKNNQKFTALNDLVKEFYYAEKWLRYSLDKIDDQDIASAALDTIVNHGRGPWLIQQALQSLGKSVTVDGRIGPATLSLLNLTPAKTYLPALYNVRQDYYKALVAQNPALAKFLPGWLSRIDKWKGAAATGGLLGLAAIIAGLWYYLKNKKIV